MQLSAGSAKSQLLLGGGCHAVITSHVTDATQQLQCFYHCWYYMVRCVVVPSKLPPYCIGCLPLIQRASLLPLLLLLLPSLLLLHLPVLLLLLPGMV